MFKHISVHAVHVVARQFARNVIKEQLRDQGVRVSLVPIREINEKATEYLASHPEVWRYAIERARQWDEEEDRRKRKVKQPLVTPMEWCAERKS